MRVLILSPSFFGYERSVAEAFRAHGHDVHLVDERPSNRAIARAAVRTVPILLRHQVTRHYENLLRSYAEQEFDALLVIKGEVVPQWFLEKFSLANPSAVSVYYTFDSRSNSPQASKILHHFSHRYTFDRADAESDPTFRYKPLFYSQEYVPDNTPRDLALSFVGTLHGDRYAFTQAVAEGFAPQEKTLFYFIPAAWFFWLRKLTSRNVRRVPRRQVSTAALSRAETVALVKRSRAVIDLQRAGQAGLTMRTFEVLAAGAALITSNDRIRDESFFDPERILIVPRSPDEIDTNAVTAFVSAQPRVASSLPGFEIHSLSNWVEDFLRDFGDRRA